MSLLASLKRLVADAVGTAAPDPADRLYRAAVAEARQPAWYLDGAVPDTLDGRFDALVLVLALVMLRLEDETAGNPRHPAARLSADLADRFIADMEGNLRQDGISDQAVPRHMGQMMAALGGRIGAYRDGRGDTATMADALRRNLYRGADVPQPALDFTLARSIRLRRQLAATDFALLAAGTPELAERP